MSILAAVAVPHPPLLIPEVGRGEESKVSATRDAYETVSSRLAELKPELIVLISPHSIMYSDYIHISPGAGATGDMGRFRAGNVRLNVKYDQEFVRELEKQAKREGIPAGTSGERERSLDHGTIVPLYFLEKHYTDYKLVRIGLSGLSPTEHFRFGQCIARAVESLGRRAAIIASGDLSHKLKREGPYGYAPEGAEFDRAVTEALGEGDFLSLLSIPRELADAAAECGLRSFQILAGALDKLSVTHELLSYEGTFGVGYGVAYFEVTGADDVRDILALYNEQEQARMNDARAHEDAYVRLARDCVETYVRTGRKPDKPSDLPEEMLSSRAGVFVSIKKHGQLRGCIGTISPVTRDIADEILSNAVSAATRDPRFSPISASELSELTYSVDVMGESEPISSADQLDAKRYGVIVQNGARRGLLLPNLEGVDSVEQQVDIAKQKAGIRPNENVNLYRFEVVRHR